MKSMVCKNEISVSFFFILFFIVCHNATAQNCTLTRLDSFAYHVKQRGKIEDLYNKVRLDSSKFHIMLIKTSALLQNTEAVYVGINSRDICELIILNQDSVIYSTNRVKKAEYELNFIYQSDLVSANYYSECKEVISSHARYLLIFLNPSKGVIVEYLSMDGFMKETLLIANNDFLLKLYRLVDAVSKNLEIL